MRSALALLLLVLAGCGGASAPTADEQLGPDRLVQALEEGGLVVYLRHAATDRSQEDTHTSDLTQCKRQRNLTEAGREQARLIGRSFRALKIPVGEVRASEYCRTRETAELAFGEAELDPDLTGFPNESDPGFAARVDSTRELLGSEPAAGENTILVAHVKNIEAAAGISIEEGELAVFEPSGSGEFTHLGDIPAAAWPQLVTELASP